MPRKVVRVYFSKELKIILDRIAEKLGLSESEILRIAFLDYAKSTGELNQ